MKDLPLRPAAPGAPVETGRPPNGLAGAIRSQAADTSPQGLGADQVIHRTETPTSDFLPACADTRFDDCKPSLPAPGTPEAALLQAMHDAPGLPPQWQEAFQALPAAEQRAMAQMYQRLTPSGQASFLRRPPDERVAMNQVFGRMQPVQQTAFLAMTPGQQRSTAQMYGSMTGLAKAALLAKPASEQLLMVRAFQSLDEPARAAFQRLDADEQAQFGRVWAEAGRTELGSIQAPEGGSAQWRAAVQSGGTSGSTVLAVRVQLMRLLTNGRLTQTVSGGQSALGALDRLRTAALTLPPGSNDSVYRQQLANTLIAELESPVGIRQGNYNTCGATIAQRMFARENPGAYAAFVVGLVSSAGQGALPDGAKVRREADSLVPLVPGWTGTEPRDNRNQIERIVQAALMDHASVLTYSNSLDSNTILGIPIASGLNGGGIARLSASIRHRSIEVLSSDSLLTVLDGGGQTGVSAPTLMTGITAQRHRHPQEAVPVEIHFNAKGAGSGGDLHWVEVSGVTTDRVHYLNPHGNKFQVPGGQTLSGLPVDPANGKHYIEAGGTTDDTPFRRIYEDGTESVSLAWFERAIEEVMVDPDIRSDMRASESRPTPPF